MRPAVSHAYYNSLQVENIPNCAVNLPQKQKHKHLQKLNTLYYFSLSLSEILHMLVRTPIHTIIQRKRPEQAKIAQQSSPARAPCSPLEHPNFTKVRTLTPKSGRLSTQAHINVLLTDMLMTPDLPDA